MKAPFPLSILQGDFGQPTPPGGQRFNPPSPRSRVWSSLPDRTKSSWS
jgi:hypothetical protein